MVGTVDPLPGFLVTPKRVKEGMVTDSLDEIA